MPRSARQRTRLAGGLSDTTAAAEISEMSRRPILRHVTRQGGSRFLVLADATVRRVSPSKAAHP